MLVGGIAAEAGNRLDAHGQPAGNHMPFPGPGPGKLHPVIVTVRQVQAQAHGTFQIHRFLPPIDIADAPGHGAPLGKHSVIQLCLKPCHSIRKLHHQRVRFLLLLHISSWQARKPWLPCLNPVSLVPEIRQAAAVWLLDFHCRAAVIPRPIDRKLLLNMLQRKCLISQCRAGGHGTGRNFQQIRKILPVMDAPAKIKLPQLPIGQDNHQIANLPVEQMKCLR